ncbi:MAG: hypothetical protein Kow00127_24990 [Bacteroidales bacterium]
MKPISILFAVLISIPLQAQYSREEATVWVVQNLVGADSLFSHHLFANFNKIYEGDTVWGDDHYTYHVAPWPVSWLFFVDDIPLSYWAHDCRYIFFDVNSGEVSVKPDDWPPMYYLSNHSLFLSDWEQIYSVGVNNPVSTQEWQIFAADNQLFVKTSAAQPGTNITCRIYSLNGRLITEKALTDQTNQKICNLELLPPGVCLAAITGPGGTISFTQKIFVP